MLTGLRASALPDDTLRLQPGQAYLLDTRSSLIKVRIPPYDCRRRRQVGLLRGAAPSRTPLRSADGFRPRGRSKGTTKGTDEGATDRAFQRSRMRWNANRKRRACWR